MDNLRDWLNLLLSAPAETLQVIALYLWDNVAALIGYALMILGVWALVVPKLDSRYLRWLEAKVDLYEQTLQFYARQELYLARGPGEQPPICDDAGEAACRALASPD